MHSPEVRRYLRRGLHARQPGPAKRICHSVVAPLPRLFPTFRLRFSAPLAKRDTHDTTRHQPDTRPRAPFTPR